jgi:5-methylthioribose kinase
VDLELDVDLTDREQLAAYLAGQGWLAADEEVRDVGPAGEGNMNLVLRVRTGRRSLVVKQGRPWVARYPQIPAPVGRTEVEHTWYSLVGGVPDLAQRVPDVLGYDPVAHVLALSDLGERGDLSAVYAGRTLTEQQVSGLVDWLGRLHAGFAADERARRLANREMRVLNHEHIFVVPVTGRGAPDLDEIAPGLDRLARRLRSDTAFTGRIAELGVHYLGGGSALLHGDFFPGSWLAKADEPVWVIDPEFGFFGPPEWDVAIMLAHLAMAEQPRQLTTLVRDRYPAPGGFDWSLVDGFAGAEITRRLLGVARLPLRADLAGAAALLDHARSLVTGRPLG